MKYYLAVSAACSILCSAYSVNAASAPAFYGDPPDDHHPWAVHDGNRPQPKVVTPGTFSTAAQPGRPPSDAIVLFNGKDLSNWVSDKKEHGPAQWLVIDGVMQVVPKTGGIQTKEQFGDCQLHVEWAEPSDIQGSSQGRGNSGIFLMGCEIQVLDSYNNITYADGHAASLYGVMPPMVNAIRPPGQFQVYDIVFRRPIYKDGQQVDPGYVTVFVNGVLAQDHTSLEGPTGHKARTHPRPFPEKGPLALQDHGNPIRFRNIWYRPLPPRPIEGGTDGYLTTEATMAKRKAIAADIRQDAAHLADPANPMPELLRLLESLAYAPDEATLQKVTQMSAAYVQSVKGLSGGALAAKKDEVKQLKTAFDYLSKAKALPESFAPKSEIDALVRQQRWDKK